MNQREQIVRQHYEDEGYTVVHRGAPDFLCFKRNNRTGEMQEIIFVEVKPYSDKDTSMLTKDQELWKEALERLKFDFRIESAELITLMKEGEVIIGDEYYSKGGVNVRPAKFK